MLTDSFVKKVKTDKDSGEKHSDGGGLYLLVKPVGRYWRMNYRFDGKQKTLSFGVYPDLSLAGARKLRDEAREKLAAGIDPGAAKKEKKEEHKKEIENSFRAVSLDWLQLKKRNIASGTSNKIMRHLETHLFHEL